MLVQLEAVGEGKADGQRGGRAWGLKQGQLPGKGRLKVRGEWDMKTLAQCNE